MPQPKGSNGPTPRTLRELVSLEIIDQTDDHCGVAHALDAVERAVAHARRRLGSAHSRAAHMHHRLAIAQAREDDGPPPTPLAQIITFPAGRAPEPPADSMAVAA